MPFQINLDSSILETSSQFPYILGNIMVNDYLRGLDPLKDNRTPEEEFLSRFGDARSSAERQAITRHRFITQISANEPGYGNDPRGATATDWIRDQDQIGCVPEELGLSQNRFTALGDPSFPFESCKSSFVTWKAKCGPFGEDEADFVLFGG